MALGKGVGGFSSGGALTVKDEGTNLSTAVTSIDFVGAGVTATGTTAVTVTIPGGTPAEVLITETVLGATAASVSFSSIAATYRDLRVVVRGRGDKSAAFTTITLRLNNDSSAIYDYEFGEPNGGAAGQAGAVAQTSWFFGYLNAATSPSGVSSASEARIYDYRGTTFHKTMHASGGIKTATGAPAAGNLFMDRITGWYRSTSAVNRVDVFVDTGNFIAGTVISLYGIL